MTLQNYSIADVVVTVQAAKKKHRLYPVHVIQEKVHALDGALYKKQSDVAYHLVDDHVIVFREDESGRIVVITQTHKHEDYESNPEFVAVESLADAERGLQLTAD